MAVYLIGCGSGFLFARAGYDILSGLVLILCAVYLYWQDYRTSGNLLHLRGLFALSWVGGQGLSCLKLSYLQESWTVTTWACFFLAFSGFWLVYELCSRYFGEQNARRGAAVRYYPVERSLFQAMTALTCCCTAAFVFEAAYLGYVPLLVRGVPHAYSYFHVTGIHYITVSSVLVPALAVAYFLTEKRKVRWRAAVVMTAISLAIPVLCVSRFQLILAVALALFTYGMIERRLMIGHAVGALLFLIPVYVGLTVARSHDVSYLNGIFEMKAEHMPIFISQPYIYIANNYDNFDCLVRGLQSHSLGLKSLFPLWTLSGLKFLYPSLVQFPIYVNKTELTTLTLFYDAYYDFGVTGVFLFSGILGAVSWWVTQKVRSIQNPVGYLFYAQLGVYLSLSFFTTWFSNPTTWFYLAVTGLIYAYCNWKKR